MAVMTITIPDELKRRLEEVENKSGLIAGLLMNYFEDDFDTIEVLEAKIKQLEEENKERMVNLQEKIFIKKQELEQIKQEEENKKKILHYQQMAKEGKI